MYKNCALTGLPHQNGHSLWAFYIYLPSASPHPAQAGTGNYWEGTKDSRPCLPTPHSSQPAYPIPALRVEGSTAKVETLAGLHPHNPEAYV